MLSYSPVPLKREQAGHKYTVKGCRSARAGHSKNRGCIEKEEESMAKKKSASKRRKGSMAPEAVAMKAKLSHKKPNAFETIWSQKKFNILGKKQKSQGRRLGLARSLAVEKRNNTLLQEYKQSAKSNVFLDKRFGEKDDTMAEEDRALLRFQRQRQAEMRKKSKFTLQEDEDGDEDILTHKGESLSALDDFQDEIPQDDEYDRIALDDTITRKLNFGGGFEDGIENTGAKYNKHKTKREVMEEVIAKSKFYKAQKAKEKEEDESLKENLDKDFSDLIQSNGLFSLMRSKKETLQPDSEYFNDYEKLVKEMVLESRAHASDRTKTAEEIVEEERARLEALEEKRKKRMLDSGDSDDDNEDDESETNIDDHAVRGKKMRIISGDDLGDSFVQDEDEHEDKRGWVDDVLERRESDASLDDSEDAESVSQEMGSDEDSDDAEESDSEGSEGNWEQSDDEHVKVDEPDVDPASDVLPQEIQNHNLEAEKKSRKRNRDSKVSDQIESSKQVEELPYVINAPTNLMELRLLLENRPDEQVCEAIRRIRTCNAISLAAENRQKMQVFYGVLLQYFAVLADEKPANLNKINLLVRPLVEISSEIPYYSAICARQRLVQMQNRLSENLRDPEKCSCWPSLKTIILLRLWSLTFPASDFRHVVMTPVILLISEYLIRCPVMSGRDIAIGTFLCSMLLSVLKDSRKFCPEALNFLQALLLSTLSDKKSSVIKNNLSCPSLILEHVRSRPWLHLSTEDSYVQQELDFMKIMESSDDDPIFSLDEYRHGILVSITETLEGFLKIYEDIPSYPEVFGSYVTLLPEVVKGNRLPEPLQKKMLSIIQLMKERINHNERFRQPLKMRMKAAVPIKLFNPRFEENYVLGRDYDPDRERAEAKKLQKQLKREEKGAARELRKDNYFLQEVKAKEKALAEEERAEKYRKAMAFLQGQEHAFKSGQLGSGRKKRR